MKLEITIGNTPTEWSEAANQLEALAKLFRGSAATVTNFNPTIANSGAAGSGGMHTAAPGNHGTDASDDDNAAPDASAPNVDASGLPWDARIHSANKSRTKEGMWRNKRGVSAGEVVAVEAQLRQNAGQNAGMYMQQPEQQPQVTQVSNPQPMQHQQPMPMGGQHMPMPQGQQMHPGMMQQPPANMHQQQHMQPGPAAQPQMQMPQGQQMQPGPAPMQMQHQQPPAQLDAQGFMTHLSNQMQAKMQDGVTPMIDQNYLANAIPRINQYAAQQNLPQMNAITDVLSMPQLIPVAVAILSQDGRW